MCDTKQKSIVESNDPRSEETDGFDIQAGLTWIYPTNYPLRDYQFNIIQKALYTNTLVTLPTGLGKTFIAAVVMYNFYRWYPTGKIIFMAPTKPLVKQQIDACYNIMAIPQNVTAELTGMKQNSTRNNIWTEKRVFFVTPQVLQNDLDSFPDFGVSIKCIVFDEAHRARGNYAYCEVIRKLRCRVKYFRVLALSATPGNGIDDIGDVITNLMISHLEFRNEESPDVKPYVFQRKLETIVIPLGEKLEQVKLEFSQILEKYARTLIKYQVIQGNYSTLTKGRIFMAKKEFQSRSVRPSNYNEVMKSLNICMTLYHAYELLIRHGLRGFLSFLDQHTDHVLIRGITPLLNIREEIRDYLGPLPNVDQMPDGSYPEVPLNVKFGHPKYYKLRDILISHFSSSEENSKVIVFFEYRDSVMESFILLLQARPLVRAKIFLGQKFGITQRVQLNVIKSFREGDCNTLLSTCIGEEGLDVGEVDLIVCFDISTKSPIRMVQRMGRTGRKREGQVIILVTEGKEQQTLNECLLHKKNLKNWVGSSKLMEQFFVRSSRMVPESINPQCMKMNITVDKPIISKKSTLKDMFRTVSSSSSSSLTFSEEVEIIEIEYKIPEPLFLFNKSLSDITDINFKPAYHKYIENQRTLQGGAKIKSSDASNLFVSLMKFADSRRFNIPLTQDAGTESYNKNLKQGDIRSMFTRVSNKNDIASSQDDFTTQKIQSSSSAHNDMQSQCSKEESKLDELYRELHMEIANYLSIELLMDSGCDICDKLFECRIQHTVYDDKFLEGLRHWIPPDLSKIERITLEDLESYDKMMYTEPVFEENNVEASILDLLDNDISTLFRDSKIDEEKLKDKSVSFNAPKSFNDLLDTFNISSTHPIKEQQSVGTIEESSDISETQKLNELLSFFKLDRIEDIYEPCDEILDKSSECDKTIICSNLELKSHEDIFESYQLSPVLGTQNSPRRDSTEDVESGSPVLKPCKKLQSLKDRSKERRSLDIIDTSIEESTNFPKNKFFRSQIIKPKFQRTVSSSSAKTTAENCDEFNDSKEDSEDDNLLGYFGTRNRQKTSKKIQKDFDSLDIGDMCDLSAFGLTKEEEPIKHNIINKKNSTVNVHKTKSHINNAKRFKTNASVLLNKEITIEKNIKKINLEDKHNVDENNELNSVNQPRNDNRNDSNIDMDDFCDLTVFGLIENDKNAEEKNNLQNQPNSPVYERESFDLKSTGIEFDGFLEDLNNKHMSTQREFNEKHIITDNNLENISIKSTAKVNMKMSECSKYIEPENNQTIETVIIDDSPVKDNVVDLTLSPEQNKIPSKRKVLSQLSITQIISLATKPTLSNLSLSHAQSNTKLDKTNLDISENFSNKFDKTKLENVTPKKSNPFVKSQSTPKSVQKKETPQKLSLMDDLDNFEEFNDSFSINKPSPVFKKPEVGKLNSKSIKVGHKNSSLKVNLSSTNLGSRKLGVESDDDFEDTANISIFHPAKVRKTALRNDSDDEFETTSRPSKVENKNVASKKRRVVRSEKKMKQSKKQCDFIEQEAEVSSDAESISDDESSEDGSFDESFVDDDTQNMANDTQMHAKYLQSVKSPQNIRNFKIPTRTRPITTDIFSQIDDPEEPNSYVNDSFCVNTQDVHMESNDLSHLEILENELKERRKNKRKTSRSDNNKNTKRKKNIILDSDSE